MTEPCKTVRICSVASAVTVGIAFALLLVPSRSQAAPDAKRWITYASERGNLSFDYPVDVFTVAGGDPTDAVRDRTDDRAGRTFSTADGRATLQVATLPNLDQKSPSDLRSLAIQASYKGAKLDYNRATETWYVVSGTRGAATFYERVHFSCSGRRLDVWTVIYPTAEAKAFDAMVDEMARRFRAGLVNVRCG